MKKIELNNRGTILALSISISVLLWSYVMGDINPQVNRNFAGVGVNIIYAQDDSLVVRTDVEPKVDVRVSGRRNDVYEIRRSDMLFTLDLSDYGEGTHIVEIDHDLNIGTANVNLDYSPKEIELTIERVIKKTLPIKVDISGRLPSGMTKERIRPRDKEVEFKGPRSLVDSVSSLKVIVSASDLLGKESLELEIVSVDSSGNLVANIELSQKTAIVDILKKDVNTARIEPNIVGELLEGYEIVSTLAVPATVELIGEASIDFLKTEEIDVSEMFESKKVEVGLLLPEGVELLSGQRVSVDIEIRPLEDAGENGQENGEEDLEEIESRAINYNTSELSILNLADQLKIGNKAELAESLEVIIKGKVSLLDDFEPTDLVLGIDFSEVVEAGSYQVEIIVLTLKEGISIESISPADIAIVVEEKD